VTACPRRKANVKEFVVTDEKLLYRPGDDLGLTLNQSARAIWDLCDGRRTVDDIVRELGQQMGCTEAPMLCEIQADVMSLITRLRDLGLLENSPS
jgi:hypothetical protein